MVYNLKTMTETNHIIKRDSYKKYEYKFETKICFCCSIYKQVFRSLNEEYHSVTSIKNQISEINELITYSFTYFPLVFCFFLTLVRPIVTKPLKNIYLV